MKTTFRLFAAAALAAASFTAALSADVPFAVGYVTKSATNQGWLLINKGAEDAARDANVRLITGGPATHGALEDQINAIARIATQGVKALALAPVELPRRDSDRSAHLGRRRPRHRDRHRSR